MGLEGSYRMMTKSPIFGDTVQALLSHLCIYSHMIWAVTSLHWPRFPHEMAVSTEYKVFKRCLSSSKLSINVSDGDNDDDDDEQRGTK